MWCRPASSCVAPERWRAARRSRRRCRPGALFRAASPIESRAVIGRNQLDRGRLIGDGQDRPANRPGKDVVPAAMAHRCPRPSCTCRGCASLAASSTGTTQHPGRVHDDRGDDSDRQPGLRPGQPALPAGRLPGRADRRDHDDKEDEKEGVDVVTNRVRENQQAATRAATRCRALDLRELHRAD